MSDLASRIRAAVDTAPPGHVWVPADFAALGSRDAIDKALQRRVACAPLPGMAEPGATLPMQGTS